MSQASPITFILLAPSDDMVRNGLVAEPTGCIFRGRGLFVLVRIIDVNRVIAAWPDCADTLTGLGLEFAQYGLQSTIVVAWPGSFSV